MPIIFIKEADELGHQLAVGATPASLKPHEEKFFVDGGWAEWTTPQPFTGNRMRCSWLGKPSAVAAGEGAQIVVATQVAGHTDKNGMWESNGVEWCRRALLPLAQVTAMGAGGVAAVNAAGQLVNKAGSPVSGGLYSIIAQLGKRQLTCVGFGNSMTFQNPNYIHYMGGSGSQAFFQTTNAGVSGNTTAQMLARINSVSSAEPLVFVMECTNDAGNSVSMATHVSNMRSIITTLINRGQCPIIILPPPRDTYTLEVEKFRLADFILAREYGVPCYDPWRVVASTTSGGWAVGKSTDGVHPTPATASDVGIQLFRDISDNVPASIQLNRSNSNQSGMYGNNCWFLTDTDANGLPDGWTQGGTGTTSLAEGVAPHKGNVLTLSVTSTGTAASHYAIGPSVAVNVGDVIEFSGLYELVSAGNFGLTAGITLRTNSGFKNYAVSQQALSAPGAFYYRYVVPSGVTTLAIQLDVNAGTSGTATMRVSNLQAYNITQALL